MGLSGGPPKPETKKVDLNRATFVDEDVDTEVDQLFVYQAWDDKQMDGGIRIREALAKAFKTIIAFAPPCPDRSTALRKLREARMDANSAIAHRGKY